MQFFRMQMEANRLDESVLNDADVHVTSQDPIIELMVAWKEMGVSTFVIETAAPFDDETAQRMATSIRSDVTAA